MTDDNLPHSGSRWEPTPDANAASAHPPAAPVPPVAGSAAAEPAVPTGQSSGWRRGKVALAGAAAGLIVASGLGGFALANASADSEIGLVGTGYHGEQDDDDGGRLGLPGTPPDFDDDDGDDDGGFGTPPGHDEDDDNGSIDQTGAGATT